MGMAEKLLSRGNKATVANKAVAKRFAKVASKRAYGSGSLLGRYGLKAVAEIAPKTALVLSKSSKFKYFTRMSRMTVVGEVFGIAMEAWMLGSAYSTYTETKETELANLRDYMNDHFHYDVHTGHANPCRNLVRELEEEGVGWNLNKSPIYYCTDVATESKPSFGKATIDYNKTASGVGDYCDGVKPCSNDKVCVKSVNSPNVGQCVSQTVYEANTRGNPYWQSSIFNPSGDISVALMASEYAEKQSSPPSNELQRFNYKIFSTPYGDDTVGGFKETVATL
jgi:hypothetical protein